MRTVMPPALVYAQIKGTRPFEGVFQIAGPCGNMLYCIASDGHEWTESGLEGPVWEHVSVRAMTRTRSQAPNWREMQFIKDLFWNEDECVIQYHPPKGDYVNVHPAVLHMWRCPSVPFPMPPKVCV